MSYIPGRLLSLSALFPEGGGAVHVKNGLWSVSLGQQFGGCEYTTRGHATIEGAFLEAERDAPKLGAKLTREHQEKLAYVAERERLWPEYGAYYNATEEAGGRPYEYDAWRAHVYKKPRK